MITNSISCFSNLLLSRVEELEGQVTIDDEEKVELERCKIQLTGLEGPLKLFSEHREQDLQRAKNARVKDAITVDVEVLDELVQKFTGEDAEYNSVRLA